MEDENSDNNIVENDITYFTKTLLSFNVSSIWIELTGHDESKEETIRGRAAMADGWKLKILGHWADLSEIEIEFITHTKDEIEEAIQLNDAEYVQFHAQNDWMFERYGLNILGFTFLAAREDVGNECLTAELRLIIDDKLYARIHTLLTEKTLSGIGLSIRFYDLYVGAYDDPSAIPKKMLEPSQKPKKMAYVRSKQEYPQDEDYGNAYGKIVGITLKTHQSKFDEQASTPKEEHRELEKQPGERLVQLEELAAARLAKMVKIFFWTTTTLLLLILIFK